MRGFQAINCFTLYTHLQAFRLHPIKFEAGVWRQFAASSNGVDRQSFTSVGWGTLQQALHTFCRLKRRLSAPGFLLSFL